MELLPKEVRDEYENTIWLGKRHNG
jgi:hypothetical protein